MIGKLLRGVLWADWENAPPCKKSRYQEEEELADATDSVRFFGGEYKGLTLVGSGSKEQLLAGGVVVADIKTGIPYGRWLVFNDIGEIVKTDVIRLLEEAVSQHQAARKKEAQRQAELALNVIAAN